MKTRSTGMFRLVTIDPGEHTAAVILLQGGKGRIGVKDRYIKGGKKNFLIHHREDFADKGLLGGIADAPKDHYKGEAMRADRFRLTEHHADDLAAAIRRLRRQTDKPVWLVGTSRGSISAVNAATRLSGGDAPDGLVLTASVVIDAGTGWPHLFDMDMSGIAVPVLIVHHESDDCPSSPYSEAIRLKDAFPKSPAVGFIPYTGGEEGDFGNRCNRLSPHGFLGQEKEVVDDIVGWINEHS
ncbi:MAG: hypothetical protein AB2687_03130 [Candidatus Thiodiazotropha taylori]